jgi:hypothetical protein
MATTGTLQITPIAAMVDNAEQWPAFAQQIAAESGTPPVVTPELIAGMVGSAVPLLFRADATDDASVLRGTFVDTLIAQCQRNAGNFMGAEPISAVVSLVGTRMEDGHAVLRAHLAVKVKTPGGRETVNNQFWDLQLGAEATVGQTTCPNCGGPIAPGQLVCEHCGTDVRSVVDVPLIVSGLELY